MADLVPTKATMVEGRKIEITPSEALGAYESVAQDLTTGLYYKATATILNRSWFVGITEAPIAQDTPGSIFIPSSKIDLGITLAPGEFYLVSANAGKIMPIGDRVATNIMSQIGYAEDSQFLILAAVNTRTPYTP